MTQPSPTLDIRLIQGTVRFFRKRWKILLLLLIVLSAILVLLRGFYTVPTNQTGALFFMGRLVRDDVGSGIHFKLPRPIQNIELTNTSEVRRMTLSGQEGRLVPKVTGDENIIDVEIALQYRITDYARFLIGAEDWTLLMRLTVDAAMSELLAGMTVDEVLTTGKSQIQNDLRTLCQKHLDLYGSGLTVLAATLVAVQPPSAAARSFRAVADGRSEKAKKVNLAKAAKSRALSQARGTAERILGEAESEAEERIKSAEGDAARYLSILEEYNQAKKITKTNLFMDRMEEVLNRAQVILLDPRDGVDLNLFTPRQSKITTP